jgi:hypothetical protein
MVTLSLTRTRIAAVLVRAAVEVDAGWDPDTNPLMRAIDTAAGYIPGKGAPDAEATTLAAFDALSRHLQCPVRTWEMEPGRTRHDVQEALRAAAKAVTS